MDPQSLVNGMVDRWKAYKATGALEEFWGRIAPGEMPFNEAEAVAAALTLLDCYQTTLRKIATGGGTEAALANQALAYKPPIWSQI